MGGGGDQGLAEERRGAGAVGIRDMVGGVWESHVGAAGAAEKRSWQDSAGKTRQRVREKGNMEAIGQVIVVGHTAVVKCGEIGERKPGNLDQVSSHVS